MAVSRMTDKRHGVTAHYCDECHILIDPINDEPYEAVKEGEDVVICDSCKQEKYHECEACHDITHEHDGRNFWDLTETYHFICNVCDEEAHSA